MPRLIWTVTYISKDFSMAKGKRGDNNNNNDNMTNTGLRDDDSSSKNITFQELVPSSCVRQHT